MKTEKLAARLILRLKERGQTVATAESCTGGGVGHALTAIAGSSAAYAGGVISYTNAVKEEILGVPAEILREYGAVSSQTAQAMARGVRQLLHTDFGISVTGLAGPDGDGSGKPVGLVYIGVDWKDGGEVRDFIFPGDRASVRAQAVYEALELLEAVLE